MTSAVLQIIAIICMTIDHVGLYLLGSPDWTRIIGRIAMPLFVMGLVEGFIHTKSRPKYFLRLAICAVVAEIPNMLLTKNLGLSPSHNIVFGFLLGFLALLCAEKGKYWWVIVPYLAIIASGLRIDYGFPLIMLIVLFYLCRKYLKKQKYRYLFALLVSLIVTQGISAVIVDWWIQLYAIAAFVPLAFYKGKKGHRLPKYAGYVFFPAHLFIILAIRLLFY